MFLSAIHWNPDPELVNLFGISIRYYGLLFMLGIVCAIYTLKWIFKKENISEENLDKLIKYGFFGVLIGARLGHCLFYEPAYYLSHPLEMLLPVSFPEEGGFEFTGYQGLASHGGALGLLIALLLYTRKTKSSVLNTLDHIAVVAGVSAGFIRLANFMNSEIIGIPTNGDWGVIFERVDGIARHPAQLYESICYFFIFAVMIFLYKQKKEKLGNGTLFGIVLVLIFIARFFIEFIKEGQVGFEEDMTFNMGQLLSLPYILLGIGFIIYGLKKKPNSIS